MASLDNDTFPGSSSTSEHPADAPFFAGNSPTGVLLLHGYSGSPAELQPMGQALVEAGYMVHIPVLAGHGGMPEGLKGLRWEQWAESAVGGFQRLSEQCDEVFVCGFSMGGLLALHLAMHHQVAGIIAMAPALHLYGEMQLRLTGLLKFVMPWYHPFAKADFTDPKVRASIHERMPDADLDDPKVIEYIRQNVRIPVDSLYELIRLRDAVKGRLSSITNPILFLHGNHDLTVQPSSTREIAAHIHSEDQRTVWFERSGHMLPLDVEREGVWAEAISWIAQRCRSSNDFISTSIDSIAQQSLVSIAETNQT
ncbi:MAG: alpha/beta fold hydrolase [Chloroflexota bacterium]